MSSESSHVNGNRNRDRINKTKISTTSGWMAFDLKQKQKQQGLVESETHSDDPYPLLSAPSIPIPDQQSLFKQNLDKPFSSIIVSSSIGYPSLSARIGTDIQNFKQVSSNSSPVTTQNDINTGNIAIDETYQKLNYLHHWAGESLVQDVLAGVNNNFVEALSLLEAMRASENNEDVKDKDVESNYVFNGDDTSKSGIEGVSLGDKAADMSFITSDSNVESVDVDPSSRLLLDTSAKSFPIEPDEFLWEENDVYLIHRKDAIRMTRSASSHSKAATDAYVRGDHLSANYFSLKAQEEWDAAEKLNAEAAKAILTLRNSENDLWTLDLHGLHAVEAVEALRQRLQTIESLVSSNYLANRVQKERSTLLSAPGQSMTHVEMGNFVRQSPLPRQRPKLLQVITGKGNHSRGAAALPSAIRNFLSENSYHSDETRAGVIMVRPKFRPK